MQHLEWTRHGRKYHHQDEGKPNTFTITSKLGEVNVDVNGDGSVHAPYVLDGATLRHGDSSCEFTDNWQTIKRLGQTLVSKSRLYVQRDVSGTWTDVPHGIPTRNVQHDYPSDGRCTAYLDFDQIQGYAAGARLQVGVEVGGGDQETYGFRFRSPVAGTFRLEWVLEIPEDVELAWITTPTSRTDPTPIRVGGSIGQTQIRWSRAEASYRNATVEPNGAGGRILHLFLGPYTVAAQEWLTIYPDTVTGSMSGGADDWQMIENNGAIIGDGNTVWFGEWAGREWGGVRFALSGAIPSGATVSSATLGLYGASDANVPNSGVYVVDSSDSGQITTWAQRPAYGGGSTNTIPNTLNGAGMVTHSGWSVGAWNNVNVASLVQALVDSYSGLASGAYAQFILTTTDTDVTGSVENGFQSYEGSPNDPTLSITYTAGGGWEPQVDAPEKLISVSPAMGWRN